MECASFVEMKDLPIAFSKALFVFALQLERTCSSHRLRLPLSDDLHWLKHCLHLWVFSSHQGFLASLAVVARRQAVAFEPQEEDCTWAEAVESVPKGNVFIAEANLALHDQGFPLICLHI